MKKLLFIVPLMLLVACGKEAPELAERQTITYQTGPDQYAIVIIRQGEMSDEQVKEMAMQQAAQLTVDKNFRYFIIESQTEVMAMSAMGSNNQAPKNLYYELIQSGDFSKDQFSDSSANEVQTHTGLRFMIKCSHDSTGVDSIDACLLVKCKK